MKLPIQTPVTTSSKVLDEEGKCEDETAGAWYFLSKSSRACSHTDAGAIQDCTHVSPGEVDFEHVLSLQGEWWTIDCECIEIAGRQCIWKGITHDVVSSDEDTVEIAGWSISYLDTENGVAFLWKDGKRIC